MITNYNELRNERDSLDGNINRMCVADNIEEVESMYKFARSRLEEIYIYSLLRLKEKDDK